MTREPTDAGWIDEWEEVQFTVFDPDKTAVMPLEQLDELRRACQRPHPRTVPR